MDIQHVDTATAAALMSYGLAECRHCTRIVPLIYLRSHCAQQGALRCRDAADCELSRAAALSARRITEQPVRSKLAHPHRK
jgi:hypothetical protein